MQPPQTSRRVVRHSERPKRHGASFPTRPVEDVPKVCHPAHSDTKAFESRSERCVQPATLAWRARVIATRRSNGLFLFHVNAHDDQPLRERARPIVCELEPDYVLEAAGQTVRYFSYAYLVDLLASGRSSALSTANSNIRARTSRSRSQCGVSRPASRRPEPVARRRPGS
jgi:hypothetical protein